MLKVLVIFYLTAVAYGAQQLYDQCGGSAYFGAKSCASGLTCYKKDQYYSQCLYSCPSGWTCQGQLYDQCDGFFADGGAFTGPKQCGNGLTCYKKDQYYSQCLNSGCPSGWQCSGSGTSASTAATQAPTAQPTGSTSGKFPNCQFRFGMGFRGSHVDYSAGDYITIWIGYGAGSNFDQGSHGEMLRTAKRFGKMPLFYGYLIAFMARDQWGLKDCDVGTPSLCQKGSDFIRAKRNDIVAKYKHFANEASKIIGRDSEMIWLIEPDFWQYYGDVSHQENGVLSGTYMRAFFDDIATAIKSEMPNSRISWDISAWLSESAMRTWWGFFATSPHIDFLHTSGGQSRADLPNIKQNELRWAFMSTLTGRQIIADTGYGVAGESDGHKWQYDDVNNLRNRMNDGVIAVSQANFRGDWGSTLPGIRSQLRKLC